MKHRGISSGIRWCEASHDSICGRTTIDYWMGEELGLGQYYYRRNYPCHHHVLDFALGEKAAL